MSGLIFWKDWPKTQKSLFQCLLVLFGATMLLYLVASFWSAKLVIQWETISRITTLPLLLESWDFASASLDLTVNQFIISQVFEGSDLELAYWPARILLAVLAICLVVGLSLAVDLTRFWFLVSQVVFIFIMVGFKLEQLLLFGRTDKAALILAFLLYLPAGYYFHAIGKNSRLSVRLVVFGALTLLLGLVVYFFSGVSHPFLYIVNYGISIPLALTVIFILFTGHEIIYGILALITRNNTPESSNSFIHFFTLSIIFLVNVLLLYLRNTSRIDWDFYYLDAFWILMAAGVIGVWSLRQRGELFKNIIPVEPHALTGYLALAAISFTTIIYFFATANDSAIEALEDAIVFSQLSIGFLFLIYILFNFKVLLIQNLKVYKVVYKPKKMPFFSMRLGGFIGALGLFLLSNQYPLDQAITAYYNGIGDLHRIDEQPLLAKEYYKLASIYAKTNHRSNYAIASMEKQEGDLSEALAYYKQSTIKQPTPFSYVNTARVYEEQGMFFKAMFTLKDGLEEFPDNPYISNNLAGLYAKTDLIDSAYYFLEAVDGNARTGLVGQTNKLALLTRSQITLPLDSIQNQTDDGIPEIASNLLAMANNQNRQLAAELVVPQDSVLNPITFAWWYNYSLLQRYGADMQQQNKIDRISLIPENDLYRSDLELARAIRLYYSGDIREAFLALRDLQFRDSGKSGLCNDILGQWSLQHYQPFLALEYFDQSINSGYLPALWHRSLAGLATGNVEAAIQSWSTFRYRSNDALQPGLTELISFCATETPEWNTLTDQEKFWHLYFKSPGLSIAGKAGLADEIKDPDLRMKADRWLWEQALSNKDIAALRMMSGEGSQPFRQLQAAIVTGDHAAIAPIPEETNPVNQGEYWWITLGKALMYEDEGAWEEAELNFQQLTKNPFFEEGIIQAARYFSNKSDEFAGYEILLNALEINQYSVRLLKAYGVQCTKLNLDTYRDSTLETLRQLMTAEDFAEYQAGLKIIGDSMRDGFESTEAEVEL